MAKLSRNELVRSFLTVLTVLCLASFMSPAKSQVGFDGFEEVEDTMELVESQNYTYPEYKGRCHACVFASNISVFMLQAPVCLMEFEGQIYNIAEDIDR